MLDSALIIFIKNPQKGKVKTRLAATIGEKRALKVFNKLLQNIHSQSVKVSVRKILYYSEFIDSSDLWESDIFEKKLQNQSSDLGQRMFSAFEECHQIGFKKCLIVGSDIYDLSTEILNQGFELLKDSETVLGRTFDGGYYALGINFENVQQPEFLSQLFLNKAWSHEKVAQEALDVINSFGLKCNFLPTLNDIDNEDDLKNFEDLYNIL